MKPGELVIYVDESGSPDMRNARGEDLLAAGKTPNHLVIASLRCPDPNVVARAVRASIAHCNTLPGRTRRTGVLANLHAAKDDESIREHVCQELARLDIKATAIVMDKRLIQPGSPWLTDKTRFYNDMLAMLLTDSLHLYERTRIVLSHKNFETEQDVLAAVNVIAARWGPYMRRVGAKPPALVTAGDDAASRRPGLQAVDYVAWALFQVFERGQMKYYQTLAPIRRHVWDLGRVAHYSRRRPIQNPP